MRVIAFVPNHQLLRLRHATSSLGHVVCATDIGSSFQFRRWEFDVIVLNPAFADRFGNGAARRLVTVGMPVVI
jgi:hypothetical protein